MPAHWNAAMLCWRCLLSFYNSISKMAKKSQYYWSSVATATIGRKNWKGPGLKELDVRTIGSHALSSQSLVGNPFVFAFACHSPAPSLIFLSVSTVLSIMGMKWTKITLQKFKRKCMHVSVGILNQASWCSPVCNGINNIFNRRWPVLLCRMFIFYWKLGWFQRSSRGSVRKDMQICSLVKSFYK